MVCWMKEGEKEEEEEEASRSDETWRGALVPLETADAAVVESLFVGDVTWRGAAWLGVAAGAT